MTTFYVPTKINIDQAAQDRLLEAQVRCNANEVFASFDTLVAYLVEHHTNEIDSIRVKQYQRAKAHNERNTK